MRGFIVNDIFKNYYNLEPSLAQTLVTTAGLPWLLKFFFGLVVDSKLVRKRKYYLVLFGLVGCVTTVFLAMKPPSATAMVSLLVLYNFCAAFLDSVIDSIVV